MDCKKTGALVFRLRTEKGLTQKQLADMMNLSDRTVSKWERGLGCPDVSLLNELSGALGVSIERLLEGELAPNEEDNGNMKRLKFYICPNCGNILTSTGAAELSCCGRRLEPLTPKAPDEKHRLKVETVEDDFYITFGHEMTKEHYISFVAYVSYDKLLMARLYPEQGSEVRFPSLHGGKIYYGCSRHGLFVNE